MIVEYNRFSLNKARSGFRFGIEIWTEEIVCTAVLVSCNRYL